MADVVVAGLGRMGAQIAVEYALHGHHVRGVARDRAAATERLRLSGITATTAGLADSDRATAVVQSIEIASELPGGPVDVVVESIVEDIDAKGTLLRQAAARYPDAVLASNTSSISITRLGELAGASERTAGVHYWNPPLLMPLVELIAGDRTAAGVLDRMERLLLDLGKQPVRIRKDVPGFAWNRLQLALVREAVWLAETGVATPEDVDRIVRDGLARRWRFTGPFETMALGGAATFEKIAANLYPVLSDAQRLEQVDRWLPRDPATLAAVRDRRDRGLVRELALEQELSP